MKKILCTMLVIVMMLSVFAACGATTVDPTTGTSGNSGTTGTTGTVMTKPTDAPYTGPVVTFPLEQEMTFTMMIPKLEEDGNTEKWYDHPLYKKLYEETNVKIELMYMTNDFNTQFALALQSGEYGDFYAGGSGNVIPTNNAVDYFDSGILVPITEYINSTIMPNFWADLMERPEMFGMITAPDGEIYTLPKITAWGPQCHENPFWINKTWLDNLNLEVPETVDELATVLKAFANDDPNGNGQKDEIAWLVSSGHNNMNLEPLFGSWGYGVKQGTNDMFLQCIDGEVIMSVAQDEWAEYLTWVKDLYDAGAVYKDCFTVDNATLNNIYKSTESVFGFCTNTAAPSGCETDEWIPMAPVTNGDYPTRLFYNCAVWGSKGQFYVTDKCENVEVLCAWMDLFYDLENAYACDNHEETYTVDANGVYTKKDKSELDPTKEYPGFASFVGGNWPRSFMASDYKYMPTTDAGSLLREEAYELCAEYINKEIWPRPYWDIEVAGDIGTLAGPIDSAIKAWRCDFILGNKSIENDWDDFQAELGELGLDEYMEYAQDAYTVVYNNIQALKNEGK